MAAGNRLWYCMGSYDHCRHGIWTGLPQCGTYYSDYDFLNYHCTDPAVRKLRGNFDLGLFVALLFLTTIGFAVDLKQFFGSTFYITLFCFCVIVSCIVLHLLVTRLLKVKFEYVLLSAVACISDGPTAALIASSAQWKTMITTGLLMGVLAGAMGNYLGIAVAYAIRGIIGV